MSDRWASASFDPAIVWSESQSSHTKQQTEEELQQLQQLKLQTLPFLQDSTAVFCRRGFIQGDGGAEFLNLLWSIFITLIRPVG